MFQNIFSYTFFTKHLWATASVIFCFSDKISILMSYVRNSNYRNLHPINFLNMDICFEPTETVVQSCSIKKMFLEIS